MPRATQELVKGTLDLLILTTLQAGSLHGYGIARSIEEKTKQALQIEEGSLYPALYRMTNRGWIEFEWGLSAANRRIKSYRLTVKGRRRLHAETKSWAEFTVAVSRVLEQSV